MGALDILRAALSLPQKEVYQVVDSNDNTRVIEATCAQSALREGSKELRVRESQCRVRKIK